MNQERQIIQHNENRIYRDAFLKMIAVAVGIGAVVWWILI